MIVLDANILISATLGRRIAAIVHRYASEVPMYAPDTALYEAEHHIPRLALKRSTDPSSALEALAYLVTFLVPIGPESYRPLAHVARHRLHRRDPNDWPILATALALDCPIWTDDHDFFGCGIATWTTDRVELYLAQPRQTEL